MNVTVKVEGVQSVGLNVARAIANSAANALVLEPTAKLRVPQIAIFQAHSADLTTSNLLYRRSLYETAI